MSPKAVVPRSGPTPVWPHVDQVPVPHERDHGDRAERHGHEDATSASRCPSARPREQQAEPVGERDEPDGHRDRHHVRQEVGLVEEPEGDALSGISPSTMRTMSGQ